MKFDQIIKNFENYLKDWFGFDVLNFFNYDFIYSTKKVIILFNLIDQMIHFNKNVFNCCFYDWCI